MLKLWSNRKSPVKGTCTVKKIISALLLLSLLLLCGCTGKQSAEATVPAEVPTTAAPTETPTEAPTVEPTEAPTEPSVVYTNPLTGEILDAPMDSRTFAVTINNVPGAMPMYGVSKADLFFEMFVNDYCTRGLALFADIREVSAVGSVRSLRYNFTDLCQVYDAIVVHASGSNEVLSDLAASGVPSISAESEAANYYFRDQSRINSGYGWEHCLFVKGSETRDYAESKGIRVTRKQDADYGLRFAEDGTPADGENAAKITINLTHGGVTKKSIMEYDTDLGAYRFHQFGKSMYDAAEEQDILFENVIVMLCDVSNQSVYHVADLVGSGEGYFACGGRIIPIKWSHESETAPILFTLTDGTTLQLGIGSSYIAIAPLTSTVAYE